MDIKKCTKCDNTKPLNEFVKHQNTKSGYGPQCKQCVKEYNKNRYTTHSHVWKQHWHDNKEHYTKLNSEWKKNNPDYTPKRVSKQYFKDKYDNDLEYRLVKVTRSRIYKALKDNIKTSSAKEVLGCSLKEYKLYLEQQFDSKMNWNNWGEYWEIDHIVGICNYNIENINEAFHYTNTRPLEKIANRKRKKYEEKRI